MMINFINALFTYISSPLFPITTHPPTYQYVQVLVVHLPTQPPKICTSAKGAPTLLPKTHPPKCSIHKQVQVMSVSVSPTKTSFESDDKSKLL